jgi:hypothetical protein
LKDIRTWDGTKPAALKFMKQCQSPVCSLQNRKSKLRTMKEYLFLFRGGDGAELQKSPEKWNAHMEKWTKWMRALGEEGKFVGAQPLGQTGKHITGTKKTVTDGPFMEGKEMVGGYLICKANSYDEAVAIAKGCPILEYENGDVEVREIMEMKM